LVFPAKHKNIGMKQLRSGVKFKTNC